MVLRERVGLVLAPAAKVPAEEETLAQSCELVTTQSRALPPLLSSL